MSCLGPEYNPLPPREWVRFHNRCSQKNEVAISAIESYLLQMNRKANILQYNNNNARINKNQKYGQLATRYFKTYASQTQIFSNPNIKLFERINETYTVLPNVSIINNDDITEVKNANCVKDKINDNFLDLPSIADNYNEQPIIPPQPDIPSDYPSNLPYIPPPGITIFVIPDGGNLLCNRIVDPCTGKILEKTRNQICFPTTCSDVPGKIKLLCWSGREPIYFPKVKRTYGTSGNKWPINAKFIRTAKPSNFFK
jgi:predicted kinase